MTLILDRIDIALAVVVSPVNGGGDVLHRCLGTGVRRGAEGRVASGGFLGVENPLEVGGTPVSELIDSNAEGVLWLGIFSPDGS